jgi:hypothetical protein
MDCRPLQRTGGYSAPVVLVDEFDEEHSRDIEPIKDGHGDDYYYQLMYLRIAGPRKSSALASGAVISDDSGLNTLRDHRSRHSTEL